MRSGIYMYQIPYILPLLKISCTPNKGAGAWTLVPLSCASASGAARICHRGAKANQPSGGRVWFPPSHGREIF